MPQAWTPTIAPTPAGRRGLVRAGVCRRRDPAMRGSPRPSPPASGRHVLLAPIVLAALLVRPGHARADNCATPMLSTCINDDNLWPHAGSSRFLTLGGTETTARGEVGFGLYATYLSRPIVLTTNSGGGRPPTTPSTTKSTPASCSRTACRTGWSSTLSSPQRSRRQGAARARSREPRAASRPAGHATCASGSHTQSSPRPASTKAREPAATGRVRASGG